MKLSSRILIAAGPLLITLALAYVNATPKQINMSGADRAGIEKLHQQDIAATLAGDSKALANLWTDDAVRLEPDGPAEVGRPLIKGNDEKQAASHPGTQILTYVPEIKDIRIVDGWAFEWGYFSSSYRESATSPVKSFRGKLLRVMRKQRDGSWKFSRVMWNLAE